MRFISLNLTGFKKYLEHKFEFATGLNVFVGPNESGKTTLHQALVTALYGLGSRSAQLLRNKDDARNWFSKGRCQVDLEAALKDDKIFLSRDIENGSVVLQVWDDSTTKYIVKSEDAKKVTQYIADKTGIPSPEVFNQTASVQQNQMANLDDLAKVGEAVEAVFSGDEETSMGKVFDTLQKIRKGLKKNPREKPGLIDEYEERISQLSSRLNEARRVAKEKKELEKTVRSLATEVPEAQKRQVELHDLLERTKAKTVLGKELDRLRARYKEVDTQLKKITTQRELFAKAEATWNQYEKMSKSEGEIEPLRHLIKNLSEIQTKIETEEERLAEERGRMMVLVENRNLFLSPKALWAAMFFILAGIVSSVLTRLFWLLGISAFGFVWMSIYIFSARMTHYREKQLMSELLAQLDAEKAEKFDQTKKLLEHLSLSSEMLSDPNALFKYLDAYYVAKENFQKAKVGLDVLLEQTDVKKLEKERDHLQFEGNMQKKGLEDFIGFSPSAEETNGWEKEAKVLGKEIPQKLEKLNQAQGRLKQMQESSVDLTALESEYEYLTSEIQRLNIRHQACLTAIDILEQVVEEYREEYVPQLEEKSSDYLGLITHGRYTKIGLVDSWPEISIPVSKDFSAAKESLSQGALDQLFLSLRLAACDLMSKDIKLPLILDDPFVHFDDERYRKAIELMGEIAKERQVIYFTSRRHIHDDLKHFVDEHADVNVVEMKR